MNTNKILIIFTILISFFFITVDVKAETTTTTTVISCSEQSSEAACSTYGKCRWISGSCQEQTVAQEPCNDKNIRKVLKIFGYILIIAKVAVPLLIIGFGTFDLYKAAMDKDEKALTKQTKTLLIRIVTGIFIFFIPTIVDVFFSISSKWNMSENTDYQTCASCVLNPTDTSRCSTE